jgi:NAD(P)-dependent dehydrogenase (short-subunit alcohol dehydrogenase family)
MGQLSGKVALITGATAGIGRATAVVMAEQGADVVVTGRNREDGATTVALVTAAGGRAAFVAQDATSEADWPDAVGTAISAFGRLDVLVNNAGKITVKPIDKLTLDDLDHMLKANLESCFLGMKYAWPHLKAAGGGSIVNITALMGERTASIGLAYSPAKAAAIALTKAAALEGAPDRIRVNSVMPGLVWSDGWQRMAGPDPEATKQAVGKTVPFQRFGEPREVAAAIAFLASDAAAHITGIDLPVDGGRSAT